MAKRQVTLITDDLTGQDLSEAEAWEVTLTLTVKRPQPAEGEETEETEQAETATQWDLTFSEESEGKLREALKPFISGVQEVVPIPVPEKSSGSGKSYSATPRNKHARDWWKAFTPAQLVILKLPDFKEKGRIPDPVLALYDSTEPEGHIPAAPKKPE